MILLDDSSGVIPGMPNSKRTSVWTFVDKFVATANSIFLHLGKNGFRFSPIGQYYDHCIVAVAKEDISVIRKLPKESNYLTHGFHCEGILA